MTKCHQTPPVWQQAGGFLLGWLVLQGVREHAADRPCLSLAVNIRRISQNAAIGIPGISHWCYDSVSHHASRFGTHHGQRKRPQHQEEAEVQELRGQGAAEEGRQSRKVPALWRELGAVNTTSSLWKK